jgi:hypothetical protein
MEERRANGGSDHKGRSSTPRAQRERRNIKDPASYRWKPHPKLTSVEHWLGKESR